MEILVAFVLKMMDNALGTAKTIFLSKGKYHLGAFFSAFSTFFYLLAILHIAKSNNIYSIIAMCVATYIGTYIPGVIIKRTERDNLYIFHVTADNFDNAIVFKENILDENLAIQDYISYKDDVKTIAFEIYCKTKKESKKVKDLIPRSFKYYINSPLYE